ncbi:Peptidase S8, subtilisin-related [Trema orientale]|uniref:Peptidase S8, subtilisin-related n=1 Tax=Trema orientale TaxID=63057 RepID=A0A2P5BP63_TREOI|nr:Peptidase S8, subtilisin-related [Trema orientale]
MDKSFMAKTFSSYHHWYSSIIPSSTSLLYTYQHAVSGFSAVLTAQQVEFMKRSQPGSVCAYCLDRLTAKVSTTHTPEFLSLKSALGLWPASRQGQDVVIGVVDSGIWPESLSFKDHGMTNTTSTPLNWKGNCHGGGQNFSSSLCNSKLIGVRYFNRALKSRYPDLSQQITDSSRDTTGHGTVCSSIAAGNYVDGVSYFGYAPGTAKGVAPRARLAVFKALWNEGHLNTGADVIAAIDAPIADGIDVISASFSYEPAPLHRDPLAKASFAAMEKGIVVSTTAGNYGPGMGSMRNGILIPWVLTVTAGTTDRWFAGILTLGNGLTITGWSTYPAEADNSKDYFINLPLVYNKTISPCSTIAMLVEASVQGIVVCDKGDVHIQINCILFSNLAGAILVYDKLDPYELKRMACPCIAVTSKDAAVLINHRNNQQALC